MWLLHGYDALLLASQSLNVPRSPSTSLLSPTHRIRVVTIQRSRRPWRTLFERSLGPLPHGAVLSLAEKTRHNEDVDGGPEVVASAGKVVWANEGFERLAGVDATDVVGQNLASLLDVGLEEGKELTLSLELGQVNG